MGRNDVTNAIKRTTLRQVPTLIKVPVLVPKEQTMPAFLLRPKGTTLQTIPVLQPFHGIFAINSTLGSFGDLGKHRAKEEALSNIQVTIEA